MTDQRRRADTFLRGLLAGAVVGAAVAGSTLWERRRRTAAAAAGAADGVPERMADVPPVPATGEEPPEADAGAGAHTPRP